jgi:hypothetical protein
MCKCTPNIKTPFCGKPGCEMPPQKPRQAATPDEAEQLATKAVNDYLTACRVADDTPLGNYLMKLASVTGVIMASAEGSSMAAARLMGTAQFVAQNLPDKPFNSRPVQ